MTQDFYSMEFDRLRIPDSVKALGSVEKTQVKMNGICSGCSNDTRPKPCALRKEEER